MSSLFTNSTQPYSKGNVSLHISPTDTAEFTVWIVVTIIVGLGGSFTNFSLLLIAWPRRGGRKSGLNFQLLHFIAINLIICLINIPLSVIIVTLKHKSIYPLRPDVCDFVYPPYLVGNVLVYWCDAGLTVNRCIALCFPYRYRKWSSPAVNLAMIAGYWIVSVSGVVIFTQPSVGAANNFLSTLGLCNLMPTGRLGTFFVAILYYVPYAITGCGVLLIAFKTFSIARWRRQVIPRALEMEPPTSIALPQLATQRRVRMAQMLLVTLLVSAVCAAPNYFLSLRHRLGPGQTGMAELWARTFNLLQYGFAPVGYGRTRR
ncbi:hypothetical protein BV898_10093 [Hypsibius exemplaris]|uniref:G-protein coupled receptors family 1 profile domain-containing protein n=1 Tax=Hypsibius exemplaris TaxID=2072580 RepID=A0A1W0WKP3_HYPEX|nr:hypothetical protein BV898_10093 [Hypsibius exemplaris]